MEEHVKRDYNAPSPAVLVKNFGLDPDKEIDDAAEYSKIVMNESKMVNASEFEKATRKVEVSDVYGQCMDAQGSEVELVPPKKTKKIMKIVDRTVDIFAGENLARTEKIGKKLIEQSIDGFLTSVTMGSVAGSSVVGKYSRDGKEAFLLRDAEAVEKQFKKDLMVRAVETYALDSVIGLSYGMMNKNVDGFGSAAVNIGSSIVRSSVTTGIRYAVGKKMIGSLKKIDTNNVYSEIVESGLSDGEMTQKYIGTVKKYTCIENAAVALAGISMNALAVAINDKIEEKYCIRPVATRQQFSALMIQPLERYSGKNIYGYERWLKNKGGVLQTAKYFTPEVLKRDVGMDTINNQVELSENKPEIVFEKPKAKGSKN